MTVLVNNLEALLEAFCHMHRESAASEIVAVHIDKALFIGDHVQRVIRDRCVPILHLAICVVNSQHVMANSKFQMLPDPMQCVWVVGNDKVDLAPFAMGPHMQQVQGKDVLQLPQSAFCCHAERNPMLRMCSFVVVAHLRVQTYASNVLLCRRHNILEETLHVEHKCETAAQKRDRKVS